MVDVFALGNGDGAKAIFGNPFAKVSEEVPVTGVLAQHVGLARVFYDFAQAHAFFLGVGARDFGQYMTSGLEGLATVFDL